MLKNYKYETLFSSNSETTMWKILLDRAMTLRVNALIDTGALLTGVNNSEAAQYILDNLNFNGQEYCGVIYFDISLKSWIVKNRSGQWYLNNSPLRPCDCFAIFDESRCRGADLVLKPRAVGLVTIGPRITKDKLMQGLGRLRMLDRSQRVIFIGREDVTKSICRSNGIFPEN